MEIWKPIKEYDGLYQVSNFGRVRNTNNNLILSQSKQSKDFLGVTLRKNNNSKVHLVHRLVFFNFKYNKNKNKKIVHADGNKANNNLDNLKISNEVIENYDGEVWRNLKEYKGLYQVSNFGRVKNIKTNTILKEYSKGKFFGITLVDKFKNRKQIFLHRLVYFAFNYNLNVDYNKIIHIDGDTTNNKLDNLKAIKCHSAIK